MSCEQFLKKEIEAQINELKASLKNTEQQLLHVNLEQQKDLKQRTEVFEQKIRTLETKSENLAAENFEHVVANVSSVNII